PQEAPLHLNERQNDPQDKEASKMANATVASGELLTLNILVGELEKLHKGVTSELTASLNITLAPIQASLQTITETTASHTVTITAMETTLTAHSDRITTLEKDVTTLRLQLETTKQVNKKLQLAVEDLISHSKRKNLRVISIPEGAEGTDALHDHAVKESEQNLDLELERTHRSLAPKPLQGSRPFIIHFHKYIHKERVLQWAKKNRDVSYLGQSIRIFEDFSHTLAKKRASFNKLKSQLYKDGTRFGVIHPAHLWITMNGQMRIFDSAEEAERFYLHHRSKEASYILGNRRFVIFPACSSSLFFLGEFRTSV
uniref:L1 transposable element RRM domain-containing protein n=1 Tax=Amphiprion ocellaris TaxID=80972 RepID=A0AAQ6A4U8_AMPOC